MKTVSMSGALRAHVGKKDAKKSRNEGKIPCVLYGGKEQVHFVMNEKDFSRLLFTPDVYLVKLNIDGSKHSAILQDVQYHPVSDRALHADFLEVIEGNPVTVYLPVRLQGTSVGVLKGGKLIKKMRKLKVRGLTADLPEEIVLSIDKLDIGNTTKIRDIKVDKLTFLDTPGAVVIAVKTARGATAAELAEEEAAEEAARAAAEEKPEVAE
jgi:large subunit ribosomal protein L25